METLSIAVMNWRDIRNPSSGGAEVYIHEVAWRWAKAGHEVTLLTSSFPGARAREDIDGVHVVRQGNRYTVYRRVRQIYADSYRGRTDVVLDAINTIPFFAPRYVKDGARVFALVFQLAREAWFYETPLPIAVAGRYFLEDRWLRLYASLPTFAVSASTSQDLVSLGFNRVVVVPPGVNMSPRPLTHGREATPTLLFVGRLKKYKLPDHAIAAFRIIRERVPDARLWVVGDGYMREAMRRKAPPGVTLFGRVSEDEKMELFERAHLLLFPSVREGWGLGVTEANAHGVPAVGYDVPGLRDSIQDGLTGRLVPPNDTEAMAAAAVALLRDPTMLRRMSEGAQAWASDHRWETTASSILQHLEGVPGSLS